MRVFSCLLRDMIWVCLRWLPEPYTPNSHRAKHISAPTAALFAQLGNFLRAQRRSALILVNVRIYQNRPESRIWNYDNLPCSSLRVVGVHKLIDDDGCLGLSIQQFLGFLYGCFYTLGVLWVGVLTRRALLLGVYDFGNSRIHLRTSFRMHAHFVHVRAHSLQTWACVLLKLYLRYTCIHRRKRTHMCTCSFSRHTGAR